MGPIALLALLSGLLMTSLMGSNSDTTEEPPQPEPETTDEPETPETPLEPVDPIEPETRVEPDITGDIGATFTVNGANVDIELGEDETRSLAVVYYEDTEDTASWETQDVIPGVEDFEGNQFNYLLADFEAANGLELLGAVDLRSLGPVAGATTPPESGGYSLSSADVIATAPEALTITANAPVAGYHLTANTDGDDLVTFLPEDFVITRNGVPENAVTTDATGTDGFDWINADADGITVNGAGGDDYLTTDNDSVTINGDMGDDTIRTDSPNTTVNGGAGDDRISSDTSSDDGTLIEGDGNVSLYGNAGDDRIETYASGSAFGGIGNDTVNVRGENRGFAYGGAGDDNLGVAGEGSQAYGGNGDDFIAVSNGTTGFGEAGDDYLQVDEGGTAFGGTGDDLFTAWNRHNDPDGPAILTGGEGSDTFDALVRNAAGGEADDIYMQITDFDCDEDVLQVGAWNRDNPVSNIKLVEAADGSFTDVRVTGMTADQVIITT